MIPIRFLFRLAYRYEAARWKESGKRRGAVLWVTGLWRKIGNFTYGMEDNQGKIAMDGDFRSHKAGCRRLRPVRLVTYIPIPLVKSDLKTSPETQSTAPLPFPLSFHRAASYRPLTFVYILMLFLQDFYVKIGAKWGSMRMTKILVIEDDNSISELICMNLGAAGYEAIPIMDGLAAEEFLQDAKSKDIALALVDVMLPGKDGFALMEDLQREEIPVIYLTAKDDVISKVHGLKAGAEDYIVKPFEVLELLVRMQISRLYRLTYALPTEVF